MSICSCIFVFLIHPCTYFTIATADIGMYEEIGDKGNGMFTVHRINVNTSVYVYRCICRCILYVNVHVCMCMHVYTYVLYNMYMDVHNYWYSFECNLYVYY